VSFAVHTRAYSGPFDLLLQLVSRQKVDIGSISLAEVADQYLSEVGRMEDLDLDVASDFLLVASTLLDMKASSLVPQDFRLKAREEDDDDEGDDELTGEGAREVLIARLIAYKQIRSAALALGARQEATGRMRPRTVGPDPEFVGILPDYLAGISLRSLAVICADLDAHRDGVLLEAEHVAPRRLPIALTVAVVERMLRVHPTQTFSELVGPEMTPDKVVATFLAILELYKAGVVHLEQSSTFGEIDVSRVEGVSSDVLESVELTSGGEE
jgi:segregation and condensation protein A